MHYVTCTLGWFWKMILKKKMNFDSQKWHPVEHNCLSETGFYFSYGGYGCYSVHITLGSQERYSKNSRSGSGLDPVQDHRGQALHQGQRDPAEEVVHVAPATSSPRRRWDLSVVPGVCMCVWGVFPISILLGKFLSRFPVFKNCLIGEFSPDLYLGHLFVQSDMLKNNVCIDISKCYSKSIRIVFE